MSTIAVFRYIDCEGPGYFADFLDARSVPYQIIEVDSGMSIPSSIDSYPALVFMGGPMSVNDDLPWIAPTLDLIRQAVASDRPVLGHCLGGQLLAKAMGATVSASPVKEIGWMPVRFSDSGRSSGWSNGAPDQFEAFHWHGETFSIPDGATHLLQSEHCSNQAFVRGNALALQCHLEIQAPMVHTWAEKYADELHTATASVQHPDVLTERVHERAEQLHRVADIFYQHWLDRVQT